MAALPPGAAPERVDQAKRTALVRDGWVMFGPTVAPADALAAARELLGPSATFSHLSNGYPVFVTE